MNSERREILLQSTVKKKKKPEGCRNMKATHTEQAKDVRKENTQKHKTNIKQEDYNRYNRTCLGYIYCNYCSKSFLNTALWRNAFILQFHHLDVKKKKNQNHNITQSQHCFTLQCTPCSSMDAVYDFIPCVLGRQNTFNIPTIEAAVSYFKATPEIL